MKLNLTEMMQRAKEEEDALIFVLNSGHEIEISFNAKTTIFFNPENTILRIGEYWELEDQNKVKDEGYGEYLFRVSAIDSVHIA